MISVIQFLAQKKQYTISGQSDINSSVLNLCQKKSAEKPEEPRSNQQMYHRYMGGISLKSQCHSMPDGNLDLIC